MTDQDHDDDHQAPTSRAARRQQRPARRATSGDRAAHRDQARWARRRPTSARPAAASRGCRRGLDAVSVMARVSVTGDRSRDVAERLERRREPGRSASMTASTHRRLRRSIMPCESRLEDVGDRRSSGSDRRGTPRPRPRWRRSASRGGAAHPAGLVGQAQAGERLEVGRLEVEPAERRPSRCGRTAVLMRSGKASA